MVYSLQPLGTSSRYKKECDNCSGRCSALSPINPWKAGKTESSTILHRAAYRDPVPHYHDKPKKELHSNG